MKKSGKVKNPCKICCEPVSNKKGVQCKGACKKWAHYTCLKYTPGKIQDIKAGLIVITCPCPNCNVPDDEKECSKPPPKFKCDDDCFTKTKPMPIPSGFKSKGNSDENIKCNSECTGVVKTLSCDLKSINAKTPIKKTSCTEDCPRNSSQRKSCIPPNLNPKSASYSCLSIGEGIHEVTGTSEEIPVVNKNTKIKNCDFKPSCSDTKLIICSKGSDKTLLLTIHELCSTVGQLSNHIKKLMSKMMTTLEKMEEKHCL